MTTIITEFKKTTGNKPVDELNADMSSSLTGNPAHKSGEDVIKEVVTSTNTNQDKIITTPVRSGATKSQTNEYLVYYFFGALETLLVFRLILKIAGAGINSWFVSIIYTLSRFFVMPFDGMFRKVVTEGLETRSVFEPSTFVAIIVYAVLAIGIVKLIRISSGEEQTGGE